MVVWVAVLVLVSLGATFVVRYFTDPQRRFLGNVRAYAAGWSSSAQPERQTRDHAWIVAHPSAVVADGQRACTWLAARHDPPAVDRSGRSEPDRLAMYYVKNKDAAPLPLGRISRWGVVVEAWNYLCPDVRAAKTSPRSNVDD
jgi:hypothetical protein